MTMTSKRSYLYATCCLPSMQIRPEFIEICHGTILKRLELFGNFKKIVEIFRKLLENGN